MANVTAKTSSNIFYKARCEAATHNEQLSSREGAADYMSIDRGRLYRIESGIAVPYPEEIRLMADLYNAPELENYFCRTMCPLGCEMPKAELANLDRITVRTLSVFRKIGKTKEMVFVISLTSMVAFAFSFTGTPADEVDETEIIVSAVVSEEADAMPTTEPITTTGQEMVKNEQSKIGSMDWDSDDAYKLAKIAMAEAESEDTEGKALVMLVVLNRVWDDEFPDTIEEVIFQKGQFSPIGNGRYDEVEPDEDCYRALQLIQTDGWDESHGATYFESKSDSTWHSENLTFLFKHGKHYFYKE